MSQDKCAGGWDGDEVHVRSKVSLTSYFSRRPVKTGFRRGGSAKFIARRLERGGLAAGTFYGEEDIGMAYQERLPSHLLLFHLSIAVNRTISVDGHYKLRKEQSSFNLLIYLENILLCMDIISRKWIQSWKETNIREYLWTDTQTLTKGNNQIANNWNNREFFPLVSINLLNTIRQLESRNLY